MPARLHRLITVIGLFLILPAGLFAGVPQYAGVTTDDDDKNGLIDRLYISFTETVVVDDPGGGGDALDCLTVTGYGIESGDYGGTLDTLTLLLVEGAGYDTSATPDVKYDTGKTSSIKSLSSAEDLVTDLFTSTADGAKPVVTLAKTYDNDGNGRLDRIEFEMSESVVDAVGTDNFDISGYTGEAFDTGVTGISGGIPDSDVDDDRFRISITEIGSGYDTGAVPLFDYTPDGSDDIEDASGNKLDTVSGGATQDGAAPVLVESATYDIDADGRIDRVEFKTSEVIQDGFTPANFDVSGYGGEGFSTTVTGLSGGVPDADPDDDLFSITFTEGGGFDTGATPVYAYTAGGTPLQDPEGNTLENTSATAPDGANPVLTAVETTRHNITGTDWWNRINLTYSETVWCGDLDPDGILAASDARNGNFDLGSEHGGDYTNGTLAGYGGFADGANVTVPPGEVGVTVEAGGTVRFDLGRSDNGHGSISGGDTPPSGNFTPVANTGIRDAPVGGNSLITTTPVSLIPGTAWDLDKPTITKEATYDLNGNGHIDRVEFEISDASSSGIQDGFNADNFDITGYGGEGFNTGVIGINGGVADNDADDNRFSITFTETGLWDTDAIPGYGYSGSAIYLVDLAGNRLANTGGAAEDGALPAFRSIVTDDFDENGYIDRITVQFSENVDITDVGGVGDGLDCISVSGYTVTNESYGATDVGTVTLLINEGGSYDTGVTPSTSYSISGSSEIKDKAVTPNEMAHGETAATSDGAGPIMLSAVFYDPDSNDIDFGDYIQVEFTEAVQLSCTSSSDFELLNGAFGDTLGGGSYLDDPAPADAYINIVLGTGPSLILTDLWSVPGAGNPSGLGIKAGGTSCVEDTSSNASPEGAEVDIGGAGSNIIVRVTATDGSSVFVNPYLSSALMDSDITIEIETQFASSFVAVWYDVGAYPDGLSVTNPDDRRVVAAGSGTGWTAVIPDDDPEMVEGAVVRLIIDTDGATYYYDGPEVLGGSVPWEFRVFYEQAERVTIRNNVINPNHGDVVYLNFYLGKQKSVTITVYDLAGNPVKKLAGGTGAVGANLSTWDGKNRRGAIVVPGVYYVVLMLGDSRYVRKVLVVR